MTVEELLDISYKQAIESGFADKEVPVPEMLMLMVSELAEAMEEHREDKPLFYIDENGKPQGILVEIADVFIRGGHYIRLLQDTSRNALSYPNFTDIIIQKLAYNKTRGYRHGGKIA